MTKSWLLKSHLILVALCVLMFYKPQWRLIVQPFLLQDVVQVTGRVACDSHGKLNSQSVVLEGSRVTSSGHTIPVDLSELKQYALFPGQVQDSTIVWIFVISASAIQAIYAVLVTITPFHEVIQFLRYFINSWNKTSVILWNAWPINSTV